MDAVEYVKQQNRMCDYYVNCNDCPAGQYEGCSSLGGIPKLIPIIEQWTKEHPVKTRQSEFLKQWPDAEIGDDGLPNVAPCQLDVKLIHSEFPEDCESRGLCVECRREFWLKEIE